MRSVTWNRSETVRGSEPEEAAVRDCFFFFIFPKGALTHHLVVTSSISLARRKRQVSLIPLLLLSPQSRGFAGTPFGGGTLSLVGSCAPPESVAFSGGADNAANRHCLSSGELSCNSRCMKPCPAGFRVRFGNGAPFQRIMERSFITWRFTI